MKEKITHLFFVLLLSSFLLTACTEQTVPITENSYDVKVEQTASHVETEVKEANGSHAEEWSYEGKTGPEHWGGLNSVYSACSKGKEQSPINIESSHIKNPDATETEDITIHYEPILYTIENTGYTIQANPITRRNILGLNGKEYALEQFHFHTPSEHQFNGKSFPMEMHLVHKDPYGKLAVLGIMIHEGNENEKLAPAWNVLPKKESEKAIVKEPIDLNALLPQNKTAFHYKGSLTTPPCTEGVKWVVLEQPIYMSTNQIQAFKTIFPDNHRPVQPINEREVIKND
ncbi:carbonic anhydrase [Niallia endozanthoxylica]|uniref:carbonic anhydrase n=1 Tax=Niallia endozanthoxylica TaxID=2036016 RepID=UPI001CC6868F|nr:carbonic anhydrase [Niallia endozanthoxylica]